MDSKVNPDHARETHTLWPWTSVNGLLVAVIVVALSIRTIFSVTKTRRKMRNYSLPPGPRPYPVIGNMPLMNGEMQEVWWQLAQQNDWPVMSFRFSNALMIIVNSAEATREMLVTKGNVFNSRERTSHLHRAMRECPDGKAECGALFTPYGYVMKITRKLMAAGQNEFKKTRGDEYVENVLLPRLFEEIESEGTINVRDRIAKIIITRILLVFVFGPGAEQYADLIVPLNDKLFYEKDMNAAIELFIPFIGRQLSWAWHTFRQSRTVARKLQLYEFILSQRGIKYNQEKKWSLCDPVQEAEKNGEINHIQGLHVYEECFFGGQDTTTAAIEGTLKMLVETPRVLTKMQQEMDAVLGAGTCFRHDDVSKVPYFQAVIKEGLRLHRAIPVLLPHVAEEDATLGGYDIPKDTEVLVNLWALARDPANFPDPYEVKPERFLDRETNFQGTDGKYVVFGVGPRICAGQSLALYMVNIVIGSICQRYNLALAKGWKHERDGGTLFKELPLYLNFIRRHPYRSYGRN